MAAKYNVPGLTGKTFLIACYSETKQALATAQALLKIMQESFGAIKHSYLVNNFPEVVVLFSDHPEHAQLIKMNYPMTVVYTYTDLKAYLSHNNIVDLDKLISEVDQTPEEENNTEEDQSSEGSDRFGEINTIDPDCCNEVIYVLTGTTGQRQISICRIRETSNYGLVIQFSDRHGKLCSAAQLQVWLEQCEHRGYQPRFFWDTDSALDAMSEELHDDGVLVLTVIEKVERREELLRRWVRKITPHSK